MTVTANDASSFARGPHGPHERTPSSTSSTSASSASSSSALQAIKNLRKIPSLPKLRNKKSANKVGGDGAQTEQVPPLPSASSASPGSSASPSASASTATQGQRGGNHLGLDLPAGSTVVVIKPDSQPVQGTHANGGADSSRSHAGPTLGLLTPVTPITSSSAAGHARTGSDESEGLASTGSTSTKGTSQTSTHTSVDSFRDEALRKAAARFSARPAEGWDARIVADALAQSGVQSMRQNAPEKNDASDAGAAGDKHFSVRPLSGWDARLFGGAGQPASGEDSKRQTTRSSVHLHPLVVEGDSGEGDAVSSRRLSLRPGEASQAYIQLVGGDVNAAQSDLSQPRFSARPSSGWDAKLFVKSADDAAEPRFSARAPDGWDDQVFTAAAQGRQLRFSTRPPEGWDGRIFLANDGRARFSVRPADGWDARVLPAGAGADAAGADAAAATTATAAANGNDARFSTRPPDGWDGQIVIEDDGQERFSVRPPEDWDGKIFLDEESRAPRFSSRPLDGWDAQILPVDSVQGQAQNEGGEHISEALGEGGRTRSSTIFSKRRLSEWDAHLTQSIPIIASAPYDAHRDDSLDGESSHDSAASRKLAKISLQDFDIEGSGDRRNLIFSTRKGLAEWDEGVAKGTLEDATVVPKA